VEQLVKDFRMPLWHQDPIFLRKDLQSLNLQLLVKSN